MSCLSFMGRTFLGLYGRLSEIVKTLLVFIEWAIPGV